MKKICHITSTPQNSIPRLLRESATAIKMGIKPYIIAQGKSFEIDGISHIGVKLSKNRLTRMLITSRILINEALKIDADIYQIHDPELLPFAFKLKKNGSKVIFDSHEFYGLQIEVKEYLPKLFRKVFAKIYKTYEAFVCKRIDAVIAVCTINGIDYFEKRSRTTIFIANLPEKDIFVNDTNATKKSLEKSIVYIGALSDSRGITNIIKAMENTKAKLTLCGPFVSGEYCKRIESLPGYQNVNYKGILTKHEIVEVLKKSDIGISTLLHVGQYSEIDTLPTKVYEYMAIGLPVIISNTKYAKTLLSEYKFGISVNPKDINEISEAINYLIENPQISKEMGEVGRNMVTAQFNWSIEETKLIRLYEELLKNSN